MSEVAIVPNKVLRQKALQVVKFDRRVIRIIAQMRKVLREQKEPEGVGLAAPQIGHGLRIIAVKEITAENRAEPPILALINPRVTHQSKEKDLDWEGCLSIPDQFGQVWRSRKVTVKAENLHGHKIILKAEGFLARVLQHEIDHLDGALFTDKVVGRIYSGQELAEISLRCTV